MIVSKIEAAVPLLIFAAFYCTWHQLGQWMPFFATPRKEDPPPPSPTGA